MRRIEADSQGLPPVWLGLAWVYAGVFWLCLIADAVSHGRFAVVLPAALRMGATVGIGIGLCAGERAAWAPAAVVAALYSLLAAAGAIGAGVAVATLPPGWLSWRPVLLGWDARSTVGIALLLSGTAAVCVTTLAALWLRRGAYEVPSRRAFKSLVADGIIPGLAVFLLDGWVLWALAHSR